MNRQKLMVTFAALFVFTGFGYEFVTEKDIPYYSEERMAQEGDGEAEMR